MKHKPSKLQYFVNLIVVITFFNIGTAQEKKVAPTSAELHNEIEHMDYIMFEAFNNQDFAKFKSLFTEDLEWFQDNGGLLSYETVFTNFENMFKNENKLTRKLVKGSLEVHPIKDYGAIEIGVHEFRHMENGKEEIGTFKFLMIWKKKDNQWKISRVISYDH
jgi:ketosteroid isomerase-like protein